MADPVELTESNCPDPVNVFRAFLWTTRIPHGSGNTGEISRKLVEWATERGFEVLADATGNVLMRCPPSPGYEAVPSLLLQGHMDMVCVAAADVEHDFSKDRIVPYIEGDWISTRKRTTLGADNGIGWGMIAAFLEDKNLVHGPLEALMTVDEETDMRGMQKLQGPPFLGSRYMINLDDEDEGKLCTGSAGGAKRKVVYPLKQRTIDMTSGAWKRMEVHVHSLEGGHSGDNIGKPLGNAIKWVARILQACDFPVILSLEGGSADNAIPSECKCIVVVPKAKAERVAEHIKSFFRTLLEECPGEENAVLDLTVGGREDEKKLDVCNAEYSKRIVDLLIALPHGVERMSSVVDGLVETSISLGIARLTNKNISCSLLARSSSPSQLDAIVDKLRAICSFVDGCKLEKSTEDFPPWDPQIEGNVILECSRQGFAEVLGHEPVVYAIHAGLECGLLKKKYPDMQIVSTGPTIRDPHSPGERLSISSLQRSYAGVRRGIELFAERFKNSEKQA